MPLTGLQTGLSPREDMRLEDGGNWTGKKKDGSCWITFSDRHVRLIMDTTCSEGKSAQQIISDSKVPQSTAYRKIRMLVEENLLEIYFEIGDGGRWENRYRHTRSR